MSQMLLLQGNPKKRRGKKRRSAAQRRATASLVASNKGRKRRTRRSAAPRVVHRKRGRTRSTVARVTRRSRRSRGFGFKLSSSGIMGMLKPAMIGGAGAVAVDVAMGYAASVLPATMVSRFNADGTMNWFYYLTKGAAAYALGTMVRSPIAREMAAGSLVVSSYEIIRSLLPAGTVPLGYVNPARIATQQNRAGMGKVLQLGAVNSRIGLQGTAGIRGLGARLAVGRGR